MNSNLITKIDLTLLSDPNYNLLESEIINANNKFMATKIVKFKKYKHKINNWITHGIIKSIKYRDNLYKQVKMTNPNSSQYDILRRNLSNMLFSKVAFVWRKRHISSNNSIHVKTIHEKHGKP